MTNQITKILPRSKWQKVVIRGANEPLVEIKETSRIKLGLVKKKYQVSYFVRKTIADKLLQASSALPHGINLVLIEGYRTLESQQESWDKEFQKITTENPSEAMDIDWHKKFQMLSGEITSEQKNNRKILRGLMETQDFVWYPGEWWHYSWGDRMWAIYKKKSECMYGQVYLPIL